MPAQLSVIIPTLNAAGELPETTEHLLGAVTDGLIKELIISDGGSADDTPLIAKELGAKLVTSSKGRGQQLSTGVAAATGDWLLLLHADTHLSPEWSKAALSHMAKHPDKAGWYSLEFRADGILPKLVAKGANLRSSLFNLPYGDQGLLIHRSLLKKVGGIPELPLMEDVALASALGNKLRRLPATARTSAVRFERDGWLRRASKNLTILIRFKLGTSPERLVNRYYR